MVTTIRKLGIYVSADMYASGISEILTEIPASDPRVGRILEISDRIDFAKTSELLPNLTPEGVLILDPQSKIDVTCSIVCSVASVNALHEVLGKSERITLTQAQMDTLVQPTKKEFEVVLSEGARTALDTQTNRFSFQHVWQLCDANEAKLLNAGLAPKHVTEIRAALQMKDLDIDQSSLLTPLARKFLPEFQSNW